MKYLIQLFSKWFASPQPKDFFSHSTAVVEEGAQIAANTKVWHYAHVRKGCQIGSNCILGKSVFVDSGVIIGDNVKIQNFADWLSYKALGRFLERHQDLRTRREAAALSTVDLCRPPGAKKDAPDLAAAEKEYSLESHPDNRVRRISVFNKKNAVITKCEINPQEQGFGLCEI